MRLVQFLQWWWRKRDTTERVLTVIFSWLFVSLMTIPFIGIAALLVFLLGLVSGAILYLLVSAALAGWETWKEFSETHPTSQELLVRKLRGD